MVLLKVSRVLPLFLSATVLVSGVAQAQNGGWQIETHDRIPYLPVQGIRTYYGFDDISMSSGNFRLQSSTTMMEGSTSSEVLFINKLAYGAQYRPLVEQGRYLMSAHDLSNLLELVFRPTKYINPKPLKSVFLQPVESDLWATKPDPDKLITMIQEALHSYKIPVRVLPKDAGGIVGSSLHDSASYGSVWLRLRSNGKLPHYNLRSLVLAPPGSPDRAHTQGFQQQAIYSGNRFDAQSLALATLIQTGFAFGPGAKDGQAIDSGIYQEAIPAFQRAGGAAVQIEWGEEIPREHMVKSIVAAVLRYQAFLDAESQQPAPTKTGKLQVQNVGLNLKPEDGVLHLEVNLRKGGEGKILKAGVGARAVFYSQAPDGRLRQYLPEPPRKKWANDSDNWSSGQKLGLEFSLSSEALKTMESQGVSYILQVTYDGKIQDTADFPEGVRKELGRFAANFSDP